MSDLIDTDDILDCITSMNYGYNKRNNFQDFDEDSPVCTQLMSALESGHQNFIKTNR